MSATRPRSRHSRARRALLALSLLATSAPATLAAQGWLNGALSLVDGHQSATPSKRTTNGALSLSGTVGGAGGAISANAKTGHLGLTVATSGLRQAAHAELLWRQTLYFEHTALGYLHPVQIFLDGGMTPGGPRPEFGDALAGAGVRATTAWGDVASVEMYADMAYQDPPTASKTLWVSVPAGQLGTYAAIDLFYAFAVDVRNGWSADFSHSLRTYVPQMQGHRWYTTDGSLSEQARPAWAAGETIPGELPPTTATPEPATLALFGGGLALLVAARRRRA